MAELIVTAMFLVDTIRVGDSLPVSVSIINKGTRPLLVNGRLAVGYEDNITREIFVSLYDSTGAKIDIVSKIDYNREYAAISDYVILSPEQSIETQFDLMQWYPIDKLGNYSFFIHYQADELSPNRPNDVVKGVYTSSKMQFKMVEN